MRRFVESLVASFRGCCCAAAFLLMSKRREFTTKVRHLLHYESVVATRELAMCCCQCKEPAHAAPAQIVVELHYRFVVGSAELARLARELGDVGSGLHFESIARPGLRSATALETLVSW